MRSRFVVDVVVNDDDEHMKQQRNYKKTSHKRGK